MDPRHLEILTAIIEHNGLTEGAEALGKSQPSVSRTLAQLEGRIGAPLFKPGRRPLQPTDLGLALAEQGRAVLNATRLASAVVDSYRSGHSGFVRVGGTPIFMDGVVSPLIASFQQGLPGIRVDQSYGYAEGLAERLRNRMLDLAILPVQPESVPEDMAFQPILRGINVISCREGHPLTRRRLLTLKDIAEFSWIAPPAESPLYRDLRRALSSIGVTNFKVSFSGGSLASVISMLMGSDNLTILPYSVVFMMRPRRQITALSLDIGHPDRILGLLEIDGAEPSPAVKRFRNSIAKQFESLGRRIAKVQTEQIWR